MESVQEQTLFNLSAGVQHSPLEDILEGLNREQKQAVLHGEKPLIIVAGAGTGKTSVLTRRIAGLITSKKALPGEILALTFTDKAAREMEDRVDRLVPYGFNDVCISTFHSFGDKILREFAFEIGYSPDLRVLTLPETIVLVRQNLFRFKLDHYRPLSDPARFVEALLTTFSRAKDEEIGPEEFVRYAKEAESNARTDEEKEEAKKNREVAQAYQTYEDLKARAGFIDFGDQVLLCLKIFREHPSVLAKVQNRFKYILVDEFQDTNYGQFQLLKLLAAPHRNITVVGDDDQSIYKFRGACLSNILGFRKTYPETEKIVLQENYRSTPEILASAYKLIQHNNPDRLEYQDNLNKSLRSQKASGAEVRYQRFDTLFSESEFVATEIKKRVEEGKNQPKDFAILVRTNAGAEPFMKSLNLAALPWQFSGSAGLYEQEEIRVALSFLRALDAPDDSASLYYLAISPLYGLDPEECAVLTQLSAKTKRPLWEIFREPVARNAAQLSVESAQKIETIVADLKKFRNLSAKMPTGNLLYTFFEERGLLKQLAESDDYRSVQHAQNLHRFFEIIKKFGQVAQYDRAHYFIQYVESLRHAGEDPSSAQSSFDDNAVNILTVHAAKGLEFPVVYMVGLEQGHFPLNDRGDAIELPEKLIKDILPSGNVHSQEERRLFYVGLTRAQEELILCSTRDMGKKKQWKSSQFVLECLDKPRLDETVLKSSPLDSLKVFSLQNAPLPAFDAAPGAVGKTETAPQLDLNATAIAEYLICPLKYKFAHSLKIPTLMHHTAVFGIAIHETLKAYHLFRKEKKKMKIAQLCEIFKNVWRAEGFVSREHEDKRFDEGLKILRTYYRNEERSPDLPTLVEESFKIALEQARIRGRWDRVDIRDTESVIIDYKTGDVKDQKDADKKAKESVQLTLYAVAFQNRFGRLPDKMVLNFLKRDLIGTVQSGDEKVGKNLTAAKTAIAGIAAEQFQPKPGFHCRWCAYEKICPAANRSA